MFRQLLLQNRDLVLTALEQTSDAILITDVRARIQYVNAAFTKMTGYSAEEVLGRNPRFLQSGLTPPSTYRSLWSTLKAGQTWRGDLVNRRKDGSIYTQEVRISPVANDQGEIISYIAFEIDVTSTRAAKHAERFLATIVNSSGEAIATCAPDGTILTWNAGAQRVFGHTETEAVGKSLAIVLCPERLPLLPAFLERVGSGEIISQYETVCVHRDGRFIDVSVTASPIRGHEGGVAAVSFVIRDVSERKRYEEDLRQSEQKFRQLAENIDQVYWIVDVCSMKVAYVSPSFERICGESCSELYENWQNWLKNIHPEDRPAASARLRQQLTGEQVFSEYRVQQHGRVRWIQHRTYPIRDEHGRIVRVAGLAEDITLRKEAELRLIHQTLHDELTSLPNRRCFSLVLREALCNSRPGRPGAVYFIDLDSFKLFNDTLGHCEGDRILQEVAERFRIACGTTGTVARFGGDEFMVVAPGLRDEEAVRALGQKLIDCLHAPFRFREQELYVGASIGVAIFPAHGTNAEGLLRDANVAMQEAKRAGKNQIFFFDPDLLSTARERLLTETRLRSAIARSEFVLHYQPQFRVATSSVERYEALIRWLPAGHDLLPPSKFIATAEKNGTIVPIGTWVLREACRECAAWQQGPMNGVGIAVNVSAAQFAQRDFADRVTEILESTGLPPQLLEIELTESVLLDDLQDSAAKLQRLRKMGISVALDDFGTGYSALGYLQSLPLDAIKIDRCFLTSAEGSRNGRAILQSIVQLAHALDMRVVGEGAESFSQSHFLASIGCDDIQGFVVGHPAPADDVKARHPGSFAFMRDEHGAMRRRAAGDASADAQDDEAVGFPDDLQFGTAGQGADEQIHAGLPCSADDVREAGALQVM